MRVIIHTIPIIILFQALSVSAQNNALKKANRSYQKYEYAKAIKEYEKVLEKGFDSPEVYQKLGDSYYFNSYLEDAARWYEVLLSRNDKDIPPVYYFRAAHAFKYLGQYEKAHELLSVLGKRDTTNTYANRFLNNTQYLEKIKRQAGRYVIKNVAINSEYSDFAPSFFKDRLVFSSSRKGRNTPDERSSWTEQPYFTIYQGQIKKTGEITTPSKFSRKLDFRFHESTTSFTKYGTTVYFTGTNIVNDTLQKDSLHVNGLKIYQAHLGYKNQWIDIKELPFNSDLYSVAHPALSADNKKLYFVSDMPGGYGMSDLYVVDIYEDESFGEPINLGPEINTEGRDTFPFVSKTDMLYFSSNGHLGLGGLDVFVTDLNDKKKIVYNVGEPINSVADDMTFIIDDTTKKGYFSSNREGGKGNDDIYSLEELKPIVPECSGKIEITVLDVLTDAVLEGAKVHITPKNVNDGNKGTTNSKGTFYCPLDCSQSTFRITISKDKFTSEERIISVKNKDSLVSETFRLRAAEPASKGTDIAVLLSVKPIYFRTSEFSITEEASQELDKIAEYLQNYPSVKIEIRSHTDSRGRDSFNLWLSNQRAASTADYLIEKGIDTARIQSKGFGEKELKNECSNGVQCTAEMHLQNRRSEFVVIEN